MTMNYTVDPPMWELSFRRKHTDFSLLSENGHVPATDGGPGEYRYDIGELYELTKQLMRQFHVNYIVEEGTDPTHKYHVARRPIEDFSEEERAFYYPFAFVLSCLQGNSFANPGKPEHDLVFQYIPDAYLIMAQNRVGETDPQRQEELRWMLDRAATTSLGKTNV